MAASALIPLISCEGLSSLDQRAALVGVERIQFLAASRNFASPELLESATAELENISSDTPEIRRATEILRNCRNAIVHGVPVNNPIEKIVLRSAREAELRWFSPEQRSNVRPSKLSTLEALKRYFRDAIRTIGRRGLPKLFETGLWEVRKGRVISARPGSKRAVKTNFGVTLFNPDLTPTLRAAISEASFELAMAYQIAHLTYDLRWYGSRVWTARARAVHGLRPNFEEHSYWMLMEVWREIDSAVAAVEASQTRKQAEVRWLEGQERAKERTAERGRQLSQAASIWRTPALELAYKLRDRFPDRTLPKIAQSVAGEVSLQLNLDPALRAETVYQFLRTAAPELLRVAR